MSAITDALSVPVSPSVEVAMEQGSRRSALSEFEDVYRAHVGALTAFFARRCSEPQTVADLTSETIVRAAAGFSGFDSRRGTPRAWLFGIASHVYAEHCALAAGGRKAAARLAGLAELPTEELDELMERIDAERAARTLLERFAALSRPERSALGLVDLDGLTPKEAAVALGVPRGLLRMRLSRARARLRRGQLVDEQV